MTIPTRLLMFTQLAKTHKQIFYIHDEPPNWPSDPEDSIGLESISEPDIDMPEDDDDDFSDRARSPSASPDTSVQGVGSKSEADTEDDPIGPVTPGPGTAKSSFDIPQHDIMMKSNTVDEPISFDDEEDEEWGDPAEYPEGEGESAPSVVRGQIQAPPMAPSLSTSSTGTTGSKKRKKTKKSSNSREKQVPVPVPVPMPPVQFPFPATSPDDEGSPREPEDYEARERQTTETGNKRVPQMRTAKARDGGRTQSGGVRGVPTDDFDDFS